MGSTMIKVDRMVETPNCFGDQETCGTHCPSQRQRWHIMGHKNLEGGVGLEWVP